MTEAASPTAGAAAEGSAPRLPPHLARTWSQAESRCIKCGFCLPACPTYRETGHEVSSPRGRLALMTLAAEGELELAEARRELWFCLGCLACETACPSGIRFHDMLEAARIDETEDRQRRNGPPLVKHFLLNRVLVRPRLLRTVLWSLWLFRRTGLRWVLGGHGLLRLLSKRLARLERRTPPFPPPRDWRAEAARYLAAGSAADGQPPVALLSGCVMDAVFGGVHAATAKVLHVNGFAVQVPERQVCCGALHHHAGEEADARILARRNIEVFEPLGEAPIVVNSAGCGAMLKTYGDLLADEPDWAERAHRFSARVKDVCEFLDAQTLQAPTRTVAAKVAYDDPCHLLHAQKVREAPRNLLGRIPGLELVPLAESDWCCGSAGSYSLAQPEMSARLLARKMGHIRASGAQVVATGNPGCLLQLGLGALDARVPVRVVHPVELLAQAYDDTPSHE